MYGFSDLSLDHAQSHTEPSRSFKAAARLQRVSSAHISVLTVIIRHKSLLTLSLSLSIYLSQSSDSIWETSTTARIATERNLKTQSPPNFPKKNEETVSWYVQCTRASSDIILQRWWESSLNRCWCWSPGRRNPSLQCCCCCHGGRRRICLLHKLRILRNPNMPC